MADETGKVCSLCGESCEDMARIKDSRGRYYHDRCYVTAQRAHWRREQEMADASSVATATDTNEFDSALDGNDTMMAHVLSESQRKIKKEVRPETTAAVKEGCQDCGAYMHPKAVVCTKCGENRQSGEHLDTTVQYDKRKRRMLRRFDPMWQLFDQVIGQMAPGMAVVFGLLFIASLVSPDAMFRIFFAFVIASLLVLHLCLTGLALRESIGTGAAVLLIPFYSIVYFLDSASKARRPTFKTALLGLVLLGASYGLSMGYEHYFGNQSADNAPANNERNVRVNRSDMNSTSKDDSNSAQPKIVNDTLASDRHADH